MAEAIIFNTTYLKTVSDLATSGQMLSAEHKMSPVNAWRRSEGAS